MSGGIGGGGTGIADDSLNASKDLDKLLADLRRLVLLNGGVVLVIAVGVACIALLVRRRTRDR